MIKNWNSWDESVRVLLGIGWHTCNNFFKFSESITYKRMDGVKVVNKGWRSNIRLSTEQNHYVSSAWRVNWQLVFSPVVVGEGSPQTIGYIEFWLIIFLSKIYFFKALFQCLKTFVVFNIKSAIIYIIVPYIWCVLFSGCFPQIHALPRFCFLYFYSTWSLLILLDP